MGSVDSFLRPCPPSELYCTHKVDALAWYYTVTMIRSLLVVVLFAGTIVGAYWMYTRPAQYADAGFDCTIEIEYSTQYARKDVQQALALLKEANDAQYADLCRYVDTIDSGSQCSAHSYGRLMGCSHSESHIGLRSASSGSVEEIAGTLAHETCHFRFGHQADTIPDYYLPGNLEKHRREQENQCIEEGNAILEQLGANIPKWVNPL